MMREGRKNRMKTMRLKKVSLGVILGIILGAIFTGAFFTGDVSAVSVTKYFGKSKKSSYNYSQCPNGTWIKGWNSCTYGCGWVTIASAKSYTRGGVSPRALWKNVSLSKLNSGMSDSTFKSYAKKAGLSVSSVSKNAKSIGAAFASGKVLGLHLSGHWILAYGANITVTGTSKKNIKYTIKSICVSDPGHKERRGKCVSPSSLGIKKIYGLK